MKAIWNGAVLAESDDTVVVEGNHYFPRDSLNEEHFERSRAASVCFWKGIARYYHVRAGDERNRNAAWSYPHPFPWIRKIKGRVAFWNGVEVRS
jgi:uncharacterized protein (DUF427 family)